MRKLLLLFAFLLLAAAPAQADIFRAAEFTLASGGEGEGYQFTARVPQAIDGAWNVGWPEGCTEQAVKRQSAGALVHYVVSLACEREIAPGDAITTPWEVDGATFTSNLDGTPTTQTIAADAEGVNLEIGREMVGARAFEQVATDYGWQGIIHIWMGWDHLAFVFCLCLIARGRALIGLVTAFTVGHSISLGLAFLEVITVPMMPVEAIIALSIAFMAREALIAQTQPDGPDRSRRHLVVVSLFGLLHGLGFASALDELGVAPAEQVLGLVFFNVGVETGQLLFVAAVAAVLWLGRRSALLPTTRAAALYGVGALGAFWVVERIAGFTVYA